MRFTWLLVCSSDLAAEALVSRNISQLWGNPNMGSAQFYNPRLQQQQQFNSPSRQQGSDDSLPAGIPDFQLNRGVSQPPLNTQNDLLRQLMSQRLQNPNGVRNTGAVAAAATGSNSILSAVAASASLQPNHPSNAGTGAASRGFSRNLRVGGTASGMYNYPAALSATSSDRVPLAVASAATQQEQHQQLSSPLSLQRNLQSAHPQQHQQPVGQIGTAGASPRPTTLRSSGGRSKLLYVPTDDDSVNPYQCFARKQIELFEATQEDVNAGAQGRNKPIVLGQVGIRCVHCAALPPRFRSRAAVYYPSRLSVLYQVRFLLVGFVLFGLVCFHSLHVCVLIRHCLSSFVQAAQNIVVSHLPDLCDSFPENLRQHLLSLDNKRSSVGGGKNYWCDTAKAQGVCDTEGGLRFTDNPLPPSAT